MKDGLDCYLDASHNSCLKSREREDPILDVLDGKPKSQTEIFVQKGRSRVLHAQVIMMDGSKGALAI